MSRPLRIALIGCGTVAVRQHLPGFRAMGGDAVQVTVFASRTESAAAEARRLWGGGVVAARWQDAVSDPDVDAVDICTPPHLHAPIATAAARAGKHVLVEKPMALNLAQADAMIAAAEDAGVVLQTAEESRYRGSILAAARAIRAGLIGEVTGVESYLAHGGPQLWAPGAGWFFDPGTAGGGVLMDLGVHAVDAVRAVAGQEIGEVAAVLTRGERAVEEDGFVLFRLRNGVPGSLRVSWRAPYEEAHRVMVWGTTGQCVADEGRAWIRRPGRADIPLDGEPSHNLYADFVRACAGDPGVAPRGRDGRQALAVVQAAYESAARAAWVPVG